MIKNKKVKIIKYILYILFFTILFLVCSVKKANAAIPGYGLLKNVGTKVTNSDIQKINLNFKNVTASSNLSAAYTLQNGYVKGNGSEINLSLGTYTFRANNAFTFQGEQYDVKITVTVTQTLNQSDNRVSVILTGGINSNLDIALYSYKSAATVKYDIYEAGTSTNANYKFAYGFGDPDGGDYLYSNVLNSDIYYVEAAVYQGANVPFGEGFNISSDGIKVVRDDLGYDDGLILIATNYNPGSSGQSNFTINWSTVGDSNRTNLADKLLLPSIYYKPVAAKIRMNANGGFLHAERGSQYSLTSNGTIKNGTNEFMYSIKYGSSLGSGGLNDYNNPNYMNIGKLGYEVVSGEEYNTKSDGTGQTFNQTTAYAATDFAPYTGEDTITDLYVKWVTRDFPINYTLNGGTKGTTSPNTYKITSNNINISNPTRTGYTFIGWRKTITSFDWECKFLNFTTGAAEDNTSYPKAYHTGFISLKEGVTYTISGLGSYATSGIRWRIYNTSGEYLGGNSGGNVEGISYTPTTDCLAKIMLINESTTTIRNSFTVTGGGNETSEVIPTGSAATITLAAQWRANTYKIEYYQGNNTTTAGSSKIGESTHTYGTAKNLTAYSSFSSNLPDSVPNSTWNFTGWSTSQGGTTVNYTNGQSVINLTTTSGGIIKLYALFKRDITFYSGVNKVTVTNLEQKYNPYKTTGYLTSVTPPALTAISGWTSLGYRKDTTAAASLASVGVARTPAYDCTADQVLYYGVYSKEYTANFYSGVSKATNNPITADAYYNTNTQVVPTTINITLKTADDSANITYWTESGWRNDTTIGAREYTYGQTNVSVTIGVSNFYSVYTRTLTVSYNGNGNTGGSTSNTTKTVYLNTNSTTTSEQSVTTRANGFTKTGYTFSGWNTAANGSGTAVAASATYTVDPKIAYNASSFTKTLYAQWTVNTYTIEYYQGNNTTTAGSTLLGSSNHTYGSAKTLTLYGGFVTKPSSVPNSTWSFAGWSTAQDGTTVNYTDGQSVTSLTSTNGGVVKLYAVFKRNITFYSGVNKATTNNVEQRYNPYKTTGSITSVKPPELTAISGWTSLGYRKDTTAAASLASVGVARTPLYDYTADQLLYYGVYSKEYTANFYSGVSKATNNPITADAYYNTNTQAVPTTINITLKAATDSADITYWTESGWRDDTTAGAKGYDYGQASVSVTIGTSNFYSIYTRTLTVSYNGNGNTGGSTANTTKTIYLNADSTATSSQSITARANGFTKTGYTFSGWNTAANGSGTAIAASGSYNPSVAYNATTFGGTLYAQWSPISYTIAYTLNSGTHGSSHPTSATYDQVVNISNPTRNGYTFAGWTMSNGNTNTAMYGTTSEAVTSAWSDASTKVTAQYFKNLTATSGATVTLVANWTANTYQVTYNGNGGTQLVNSNLIAKYDGYFNNGNSHSTSTTSWPDISENNKNGNITNGTWGTDYLSFDGTTWVNLGQMVSNYQTIEVTFSVDNTVTVRENIIGNWETGGGGIYLTTAGKITGQFYIEGAWRSITTSFAVVPEKTYHVALTYDGTTMYMYVNGVSVGTVPISGTIKAPTNSTIMAMGGNPARSTVSTPDFVGKIYNAAIYDTALSETQIANDGGKVVTYTSTYGTLPDAARAGYTFKGWYNQPSGGTKITSSSTVSTIGDHMLYAQWTAIPVTISIKKDNANWNANSGVKIELRQSGNTKYSATASSSSVSISPVVAGTYDIYASKDANNLTTLVDTGIDVTVTSTGTATIDYYTLTLNKGVGISAVSGAGTYLKNQSANIDATVSNGYTWQGWSVISGDSPN